MTPREWASRYAGLGLRVVPIPPGKKYPEGIGKWQEVATNEPAVYMERRWWEGDEHRDDGIGVALGAYGRSKVDRFLFVVDVDLYKPGVQETWDRLLEEHGPLPTTWLSKTPGGGLHVWFWSYLEVTNANGLPDGIDVRGAGGQVLVHPSTHPTADGMYEWVDGCAPHQVKLAHCPDWLAPLVAAPESGDTRPPDEPIDDAVSDAIPPAAELSPASGSYRAPDTMPDDPFDTDEERPGDRWTAATDWATILEADGWTLHHTDRRTGEKHWTRPGKERREGTSATTGYGTHDVLKVFTTSLASWGLVAEQTYTKMGYVAQTRYSGDHSAMASDLAADGWSPPPVDMTDESGADLFGEPVPISPALQSIQAEGDGPEWPEPTALPTGELPPPWPRHVLPTWMQEHVENIARTIQCPEDLPGMYALGALSAAALGRVSVEVRRGHIEQVPLWLVTPAPPSEGKSPAQAMVFAPLHAVEKRAMERSAEGVAKAEAQAAVLERRARKLDEAASKVDADPRTVEDAIQARMDLLAIETPSQGRLLTSDATPERLAVLMEANGESLTVVSDEPGALAFDRYGDKRRGSNLDLYLKAWSGSWHAVDRVTAPSVRLDRPLLSIVVGAQPEAWQRALDDEEFRTRGLGSRFMSATPTPVGGQRSYDLRRDTWDELAAGVYDTRLQQLADRWAGWGHEAVLKLSDEAKALWTPWAQRIGARRQTGDLQEESAWVGKMQDTVLRVAALIHLADGADHQDPVPAHTLGRAMDLGDYWVQHRLLATGDPLGPAWRLLKVLVRIQGADGIVTRTMLAQRGTKGMRNAPDVAEALEALHASWWVRIQAPGQPVLRSGWHNVPGWRVLVNPAAAELSHRALLPPTRPTSPTVRDDASTGAYDTEPDDHGESISVGREGVEVYRGFFDTSSSSPGPLEGDPPIRNLPPYSSDDDTKETPPVESTDDGPGWALFGGDDA